MIAFHRHRAIGPSEKEYVAVFRHDGIGYAAGD
jgi:hypothetical protein